MLLKSLTNWLLTSLLFGFIGLSAQTYSGSRETLNKNVGYENLVVSDSKKSNIDSLKSVFLILESPEKEKEKEKSKQNEKLNNPLFNALFAAAERYKYLRNDELLYGIYVRLGKCYYENNDYVSSLLYYNKALQIYNGKPTDEKYLLVLVKTGIINAEMGNDLIGMEVFEKAVGISYKIDNGKRSYIYFNLLAIELYRLNRIYESEKYFRKCLDKSYQYSDSLMIGKSLFGLSRIQLKKGNLNEALSLAKRSFSIFKNKDHDKRALLICKLTLSYIFIELKQYDNALEQSKSVYEESLRSNNQKILMDAAFHLKVVYSLKKDYPSAFYYQEVHTKIKDSLFNFNKKLELFTQTINFQLQQKLKQDSLHYLTLKQKLESELNVNKAREKSNTVTFIATTLGIVLILLFYFYALRQNREKQKIEYERKLSEAKINILVAQINPHFIFSSLNSILSFIQNSNKDEAIKYLTKFSRMVRMILGAVDKQVITVNEEIVLLHHYLELEQLRNNYLFDFRIDVSSDIDKFNTEIPIMMLQPLIENAVIHGIQNKITLSEEIKVGYKGQLFINYVQKENKIICSVRDNGVGRKKSRELANRSPFKSKSMGLEFTEERLELLTKNNCKVLFNDLYDEITNEPIGTEVIIELPVMN